MIWQVLSETYALLKSYVRNRELMFWTIVFPIVFLAVLIAAFAPQDGVTYNVGIVGDSPIISEVFSNISNLNTHYIESNETLYKMVRNGSIDVGLILDVDPETGIPYSIDIIYLSNVTGSEVATQIVNSVLARLEDNIRIYLIDIAEDRIPELFRGFMEYISDPIKIEYKAIKPEIYGTEGGLKLFYVLSMIGVQILYIGMFNGVLLLIEKKRSGLLKILLSSPIHGYTVLISDTLASIVSAIISASAILATGYLLGADYSVLTIDRIMIIFILTIIGLLFMIGLGLILSTLPKTYEGAQALANLIAFPLMFLGGIVIPEFLLPDYIKAFASIFPVSRLVSTMRNILVFDLPFSMIYLDMLYGAVATAIVFILGMYVYRRLLLRAVEHPT